MKLELLEGRISKQAMEHVRLFVVMRGKDDVVNNVFKSLGMLCQVS